MLPLIRVRFGVVQAEHRHARDRLARTGLPHDRERAAQPRVVAELAHRVDEALVAGEPDRQVADPQDDVAVGVRARRGRRCFADPQRPLPHPHGFEGLSAIEAELHSSDAPTAELEGPGDWKVNGCATGAPAPSKRTIATTASPASIKRSSTIVTFSHTSSYRDSQRSGSRPVLCRPHRRERRSRPTRHPGTATQSHGRGRPPRSTTGNDGSLHIGHPETACPILPPGSKQREGAVNIATPLRGDPPSDPR